MHHKVHPLHSVQVSIGDMSFFHPHPSIPLEQLNQIRRVTFSNILCQDTQGIREVQINPFKLPNNSE